MCAGNDEPDVLATVTPPLAGFRLIAWIPSVDVAPQDGVHDHPGGPAPAWGGYRPVFDVDTERWRAHTSDTELVRRASDGRWGIYAPERVSWRAVQIARDAHRDGRLALLSGLLPGEILAAMTPGATREDAEWAQNLWAARLAGTTVEFEAGARALLHAMGEVRALVAVRRAVAARHAAHLQVAADNDDCVLVRTPQGDGDMP